MGKGIIIRWILKLNRSWALVFSMNNFLWKMFDIYSWYSCLEAEWDYKKISHAYRKSRFTLSRGGFFISVLSDRKFIKEDKFSCKGLYVLRTSRFKKRKLKRWVRYYKKIVWNFNAKINLKSRMRWSFGQRKRKKKLKKKLYSNRYFNFWNGNLHSFNQNKVIKRNFYLPLFPSVSLLLSSNSNWYSKYESEHCGICTIGLVNSDLQDLGITYPIPGNDVEWGSVFGFASLFKTSILKGFYLKKRKMLWSVYKYDENK